MGTFIKRKWWVILLIAVGVLMFVLFVIFHNIGILIFYDVNYPIDLKIITGEIKHITNEDYQIDEINKATDGLGWIFPKNLNVPIADYFLHSEEYQTDEGYVHRAEIYLKCKYEETAFYDELTRLSKTNKEYKTFAYSSDLLSMPAYVAIYNNSTIFEYALIDETNYQIYYIYLRCAKNKNNSLEDNIVFDKVLLPTKRLYESDFDKSLIKKGGYY